MYLLRLLLCFGLGYHFSSHSFHCPSPPFPPSVITITVTSSFTPSDLTLFPALLSPCPLSLFSPIFSPKWCERNEQCRRLQLRDLLVAPLQRLTRYPLLLRNIAKRYQTEDETRGLQTIAEQVDTSICERRTYHHLIPFHLLNVN